MPPRTDKGRSIRSTVGVRGAHIAAVVAPLLLLAGCSGSPDTGSVAPGADSTAASPSAANGDAYVGPPEPRDVNAFGVPASTDDGPLRYDLEYPTVDYAGTPLTGRIAGLEAGLAAGSATLDRTSDKTFLESLLAALDIDPSSQMLVFSKTSLQVDGVGPATPRAIYYNDDTYVAYVPKAQSFEIASIDPVLGPVYHTIARSAPTTLVRETNRCLRCHDSLSLTGGGVPRLLVGSGYIGTDGELVSHEGWILMMPWTPLKSRWGGWYVTGAQGGDLHLGNVIVNDIAELDDVDAIRVGNLETLEGVIDTSPYLTPYSDIVALLVVQHQLQAQNDITQLGWALTSAAGVAWPEVESALAAMPADDLDALIYKQAEPLIETLVMAFDAGLTAPVAGTSGFSDWFEARGPRDPAGRSLRALDLKSRVFRYPLSYQLYSDEFDALPRQAREYIYRRVREELEGGGRLELENTYPAADRAAALEILAATKPEFAAETP